MDSLKALDPKWPIREADIVNLGADFRFDPSAISAVAFECVSLSRYDAKGLGKAMKRREFITLVGLRGDITARRGASRTIIVSKR